MSPHFRVRQTTEVEVVYALNELLFDGVDFEGPDRGNVLWLAENSKGPVGFCSVRPLKTDPTSVFLSRAGLLMEAHGHGLHRRMIRVRCAWARKHGYRSALTYTMQGNHPSTYNLQRCGFSIYAPEWPWVGKDAFYFAKDLT